MQSQLLIVKPFPAKFEMTARSAIIGLRGLLNGANSGNISNSGWVRKVTSGAVFLFLMLNLAYRYLTIFDYSRFMDSVFIFLGLCSLVVIVFPKFLKAYLFFFGASFFLFGFRGYDIPSQVFETMVTFVTLSLWALNARNKTPDVQNRNIFLVLLGYISLSVFSLLLLPITHIVTNFWYFGWKGLFLQIANAAPEESLYSLTGINRLILFSVFALAVARERNSHELFKRLFVGIFTGCIICIVLGFLDHFQVLSLVWYRLGIQQNFNTTFMNSRWFAEFVLVSIPFVLIGFTSKTHAVQWKIVSICSLVICGVALILEGGRAGWILFPLVLFICWLFFYFFSKGSFRSLRFKWRILAKAAISVVIMLGVSVFFVFQLLMPLSDYLTTSETNGDTVSRSELTKQFIKNSALRFTRVEPEGRLYTWQEGINVGRENPILGLGYESFSWHANILAAIPASYFGKFKSNDWIHDTPHNFFLQLFVSGGVVGLCIWIILIGYAMTILIIDLKKKHRFLNMPVIISIISFHLYGIFQSMQYVPMIWMLLLINLAYAMTIPDSVLSTKSLKIWKQICSVILIVVALSGIGYAYNFESRHLAKKYGLSIYAKDQDRGKLTGFYEPEKRGDEIFQWSSRRGLLKFSFNGAIGLTYQLHHPDIEKKPVILEANLDGNTIDRLTIFSKGAIGRQYFVYDNNKPHQLLIKVSRTWNPKKFGINEDRRELGVAVSRMRQIKMMPVDGVGFYQYETRNEGKEASQLKPMPFTYRWTGKRASLNLKQEFENGALIYLMCLHPNIDKYPVRVDILGDKGIIKSEILTDHEWQQVAFGIDEIKRYNTITFQVDRTWNPKLLGISEDDRDLGVAVAILDNK